MSNHYKHILPLNEILPNLYLGGLEAITPDYFQLYNIRYVLNVTDDLNDENVKYLLKDYMQIKVEDTIFESLYPFFNSAYIFMDKCLSKNDGALLVHCRMGVSRSATMVIAYIMRKYNMLAFGALRLVSIKRPIILPNPSFQKDLKSLEEDLKNGKYN
jgi:protein-tyrosine phosphatase